MKKNYKDWIPAIKIEWMLKEREQKGNDENAE
jgi:hypothetical protein